MSLGVWVREYLTGGMVVLGEVRGVMMPRVLAGERPSDGGKGHEKRQSWRADGSIR